MDIRRFRWRVRAFATCLTLGMVFFAWRADAEPAARFVYLRGVGTETCPSEVDVRQAVQARLGYDPFSSYASSTMFVEVAMTKDGYSANLKLVDADNSIRGARSLAAEHGCADLMDAMALTICIAIDPMSITRKGPPPGTPPLERPVDMTLLTRSEDEPVGSAVEPPPKRTSPQTRNPIVSLALGPTASLGVAPALSAGASLGVDVQVGSLLGGIEGRMDLPASRSVGERGTVESSTVGGALFAGVREGWITVCAVGAVGHLAATSSDVAVSKYAGVLVASTGLRIGVGIPLSDVLEVRARAEVLANLTRHTLEISAASAYTYPIASGNLGAALAVRFH